MSDLYPDIILKVSLTLKIFQLFTLVISVHVCEEKSKMKIIIYQVKFQVKDETNDHYLSIESTTDININHFPITL